MSTGTPTNHDVKPWPALWSLIIGFFMILVDTTIVSVANPAILRGLDTGINNVIWVTSAYLLAFAVPLLVTGRLGDRFGPKRLYLTGLVIFTLASLACGLSPTIGVLIAARVVQGLGASIMSPQTMAVITRIFPPAKRGAAMSVWGSTSGVAMLVGPLAGGVLVDSAGWQWIFIVNVPVGVVGFILATRFVPSLPTHEHRIDVLGVVLSAAGLFLLVFGLQEGEADHWDARIWAMIVGGVAVLVAFVAQQARTKQEPLLPLGLFRDRNFSLANITISAVGFTVTTFSLPLVFYFQIVRGLTPTQSALMLVPTAVVLLIAARPVGLLTDRVHPRWLAVPGLLCFSIGIWLYVVLLKPDTAIWLLLIPAAVLGVANVFTWAPVSSTATRNLPPQLAGAGSGVYNTTRQVGGVIGSAAIGVLIQARLAADLPGGAGTSTSRLAYSSSGLPAALRGGFTSAMSESLVLPATVVLVGLVAVALFQRPRMAAWQQSKTAGAPATARVATAATADTDPASAQA